MQIMQREYDGSLRSVGHGPINQQTDGQPFQQAADPLWITQKTGF